MEQSTLAVMAAIIYAARIQRRLPETEGEKRQTIDDALDDARLILSRFTASSEVRKSDTTVEDTERPGLFLAPEGRAGSDVEPELPSPSPGVIGRKAEAKAARRRG